MSVYNFRIVRLSLIFSIFSFIIVLPPFVATALTVISFVLACGWWCSNYSGMLLKDISAKVGKEVGLIMTLSSMFGTVGFVVIASIQATKPILISYMDTAIWPTYGWYFFVMYIFPAIVFIYLFVRGMLFLRKR